MSSISVKHTGKKLSVNKWRVEAVVSQRTPPIQVIAVLGACPPERKEYAAQLARQRGSVLVEAERVARDDTAVESAFRLLQLVPDHSEIIVEYPLASVATEIIGSLTEPDLISEVSLAEVVCVVDAAHLLGDLFREDYVVLDAQHPMANPGDLAYVCRAEVIVKQIEYASTVAMVNWHSVEPAQLEMLAALIAQLSPHAEVVLSGTGSSEDGAGGMMLPDPLHSTRYSGEQARAGWTCLLNGDFNPRRAHSRVSVLRYEQLRPFHPGRLKDLLELRVETQHFGRVIRSAGFARLATRPGVTAQWEHIGRFISLTPMAFDAEVGEAEELLAIGQDIAIFGIDIDEEGLRAALDGAALSDAELTEGPSLWRAFPDPFPLWQSVSETED